MNKMSKYINIAKYLVCAGIAIFIIYCIVYCIVIFCRMFNFVKSCDEDTFTSVYTSTETMNDEERLEYITKYINDKYDTNVNITFSNRFLNRYCDLWIDDCIKYAVNNDVYTYEYEGYDDNGNEFEVEYTNGYKVDNEDHKPVIIDNYYVYNEKNKIEEIAKKYYDNVVVYYSVESEISRTDDNVVIKIYGNNTKDLAIINSEILGFCDNFKIIYTNDSDTFDVILKSEVDYFNKTAGWQYPNILTEDYGYIEEERKKIDYSNIMDSKKHVIILMNFIDFNYYIYSKE